MIDFQTTRKNVLSHLAIWERFNNTSFQILDDETEEDDWGWTFKYGSAEREADRRGARKYTYLVLVDRYTGTVHDVGTSGIKSAMWELARFLQERGFPDSPGGFSVEIGTHNDSPEQYNELTPRKTDTQVQKTLPLVAQKHHVLDFPAAHAVAVDYLEDCGRKEAVTFILHDDRSVEEDWGWIFFFSSVGQNGILNEEPPLLIDRFRNGMIRGVGPAGLTASIERLKSDLRQKGFLPPLEE